LTGPPFFKNVLISPWPFPLVERVGGQRGCKPSIPDSVAEVHADDPAATVLRKVFAGIVNQLAG
jgi:hypothetical protein